MRSTWRLRNAQHASATVRFPNRSRSYDATRRSVRFWGYDSAMESSFFVTDDALKRLRPGMQLNEAGLLGGLRFAS
jgi:hypothetical protein